MTVPARVVCGLLVILAVGLVAPSAEAHVHVVATDPVSGSALASAPGQVSVRFNQAVDPALSAFSLAGPAGTSDLAEHRSADAGRTLIASLPRLGAGSYQVQWSTTGRDGHPLRGRLMFTVAQPATAATAAAPVRDRITPVVHGLARWLAFVGYALLVGSAFFVAWCWPGGTPSRAVRRVTAVAWIVTTGATAVLFLTHAPHALGRSLAHPAVTATAASPAGAMLLVRLGLLALIAAALSRSVILMRRHAAPVVLIVAAALATTWSWTAHAGGSMSAAFDVVHMVATSVWLGGLVVLGIALRTERSQVVRSRAAQRFSAAALTSVGALVLTGSIQAWQQVGSMSALTGTTYGRLLVGKVAVVSTILAVATLARRRVRRPGSPHALRRLVAVEAGLGVAVLALTSVLVGAEPARPATAAVPTADALSAPLPYDTGTGPAGRGTVDITVAPARRGPVELHVTVLDGDGEVRPGWRAQAALRETAGDTSPVRVGLLPVTPGHFVSTAVSIPASGHWQLGVALLGPANERAFVVADLTVP